MPANEDSCVASFGLSSELLLEQGCGLLLKGKSKNFAALRACHLKKSLRGLAIRVKMARTLQVVPVPQMAEGRKGRMWRDDERGV